MWTSPVHKWFTPPRGSLLCFGRSWWPCTPSASPSALCRQGEGHDSAPGRLGVLLAFFWAGVRATSRTGLFGGSASVQVKLWTDVWTAFIFCLNESEQKSFKFGLKAGWYNYFFLTGLCSKNLRVKLISFSDFFNELSWPEQQSIGSPSAGEGQRCAAGAAAPSGGTANLGDSRTGTPSNVPACLSKTRCWIQGPCMEEGGNCIKKLLLFWHWSGSSDCFGGQLGPCCAK